MKVLAEEESEPGAEDEKRDADCDVVHPRQVADQAVNEGQSTTGTAGGEHPEPRLPAEHRGGVAAHGAHHQNALQAQVNATAYLGQGLTQADKEIGRRDTDGTAEYGDQHPPPPKLA